MRRIVWTLALALLWLVAGQAIVSDVWAEVAGTAFVNGNFDSGPGSGWTEYSAHSWPVITNELGGEIQPRSKFYLAWLGGYDKEQASVTQGVTITSATSLLEYWAWIDSSESACTFDMAYVNVTGKAVSTTGLCEAKSNTGWTRSTVDLSPFLGQTVAVQFSVTTDGSFPSSQYIDDVVLIANPLPARLVTAAKNGALVRLSWQHAASFTGYEVWRSLDPYFQVGEGGSEQRATVPPPAGTTAIYDDGGAMGNYTQNYFYLVRGSGAGATRTFNRTGEFDFRLVAGSAG